MAWNMIVAGSVCATPLRESQSDLVTPDSRHISWQIVTTKKLLTLFGLVFLYLIRLHPLVTHASFKDILVDAIECICSCFCLGHVSFFCVLVLLFLFDELLPSFALLAFSEICRPTFVLQFHFEIMWHTKEPPMKMRYRYTHNCHY